MVTGAPRARVVLLAGPSGCGKTSLARTVGVPVVTLDDFYRGRDDPDLPRRDGIVDWEDPRSWDADAAVTALSQLCRTGQAEVPTYSLVEDRVVGHHPLSLGAAPIVVAEGLFAAELVERCRAAGLLADAIVLHVPVLVTFWRRLRRDRREGRKPLPVLLRQGIAKLRTERSVVARQRSLGCRPLDWRAAAAALAAAREAPQVLS